MGQKVNFYPTLISWSTTKDLNHLYSLYILDIAVVEQLDVGA
jgi:hypothetical protein